MAVQTVLVTGTFDPDTIEVLQGVFDGVWHEIEPWTDASNREQVRKTIARAITDLARSGECHPSSLEAHAFEQARVSLGMRNGRQVSIYS